MHITLGGGAFYLVHDLIHLVTFYQQQQITTSLYFVDAWEGSILSCAYTCHFLPIAADNYFTTLCFAAKGQSRCMPAWEGSFSFCALSISPYHSSPSAADSASITTLDRCFVAEEQSSRCMPAWGGSLLYCACSIYNSHLVLLSLSTNSSGAAHSPYHCQCILHFAKRGW